MGDFKYCPFCGCEICISSAEVEEDVWDNDVIQMEEGNDDTIEIVDDIENEDLVYCSHCGKLISSNMQYCPFCSNKIFDNSNHTRTESNKSTNNLLDANRLIAKLVCIIGGMIGVSIGGYIVYQDTNSWFGYNYQSPLTEHEIGVIALIICSIGIFIVGCFISAYSNNNQ